jgi:O-antigen/teichoic acid export membrane protein
MFKLAGFTFGSRLLSAMFSFGVIIAISRILGPADRGVCALYLLIIAIVLGISDIAGGSASAFLLKQFNAAILQKVQMAWSLIPSFLVPFIFFCAKAVSGIEFFLLMFASWMHCAWTMQQHVLLGLHKFSRFNLSNLLVPFFILMFFLLFNYFGLKGRITYLSALLLVWTMASIIGMNFLAKLKKAVEPEVSLVSVKYIFRTGFSNQMAHIISITNSRLIFFILPATTLGLWSNSLSIIEALFLIPGSLGQVTYALLAGKTNHSQKEEHFANAFWANILVMVGAIVIFLLLPDSFYVYLFGADFSGIKPLIIAILPGSFFFTQYLILSYRQSASGLFFNNFKSLLTGLTINMLFSTYHISTGVFTLESGITGLVLGWTFSAFAAFYFLQKKLPVAFHSLWKISNIRASIFNRKG